MLRRLSMRVQLFLGAVLITTLLAVGLFAVLPRQFDALGRESVERESIAVVLLVADLSGIGLKMAHSLEDASYVQDALEPVRSMDQVRAAAIYSPSGDRIASLHNVEHVPIPTIPSDRVGNLGLVWSNTNLIVWRMVQDGEGQMLGGIALDVSLDRLDALQTQNLRTATVLTGTMGVLLLLGLLILGSRLTAPVVRLTAVADRVSSGDVLALPAVAPDARNANNELRRLNHAFFAMLARLEESKRALERQVEAVEHQRREADAAKEQAEFQRLEAEGRRLEADAERARAEQALEHLQQTQAQLVRSEKLASLGQLVAGIAHEINTPIGAVNASAEVLEERLQVALEDVFSRCDAAVVEQYAVARDLFANAAGRTRLGGREGRRARRALAKRPELHGVSDPVKLADDLLEIGYRPDEALWEAVLQRTDLEAVVEIATLLSPLVRNAANVRAAAQRARKIVMALKTFSHRTASGERSPVSLAQSVQTVLTLYENQIKMGVQLELAVDEKHWVFADPDVLAQVWTNLIQNAIQAMKGRGRLWLRSEEVSGRLRVVVGNDGPAIPPEVLDRIFEPFFTTKPAGEGTGLGLDIVQRIVEEHEGTLMVSSSPEATEFTVELPRQERCEGNGVS